MVFFTCNSCGSCLKKNQVERHMMGCGKVVCCMDCQKEFRGNEFQAHIKCITEDEKYNGPDWKPPSSHNKGERKQNAWVETVNAVLEKHKTTMPPAQVALLRVLVKHCNVPRKKQKFLNFIQNVARNSDMRTVEAVWDLMEAEWKSQVAEKPAAAQENGGAENGVANGNSKNSKEDDNQDIPNEDGSVAEDNEAEPVKKKKSKKNKRKLDSEENDEDVKTKKVKKGTSEEVENNGDETVVDPDTTEEFRWGDIIKEILIQRDDRSISLKKLKKKIFAEYYARVGDSKGVKTKEDLASQLNKKLKKKKFKVVGENVLLAEKELAE